MNLEADSMSLRAGLKHCWTKPQGLRLSWKPHLKTAQGWTKLLRWMGWARYC